eukprot:jgi/Ulvmu1/6500/UM003_0133.1
MLRLATLAFHHIASRGLSPARAGRDTIASTHADVHIRSTMPATTLASASCSANDADQAGRRKRLSASTTFACVGIDPDMGGAIALITFDRDDAVLDQQPGEDLMAWADWCRSGMSNVNAQVWDMPTYKYRLASGKLKRRVCGFEFHRVLTNHILRSDAVRHARSRGRLRLVIERPTPIPDIDGWQSAALSAYTFGVLMGALASEGMVSGDQELTEGQREAVTHHITEIQAVQWKRQLQLHGNGKDASRELAMHLIPDLASALRRKKDHGRAEAVLLAMWGGFAADAHLAQRAAAAAARESKRGTTGVFGERQQHERLQALFEEPSSEEHSEAEDLLEVDVSSDAEGEADQVSATLNTSPRAHKSSSAGRNRAIRLQADSQRSSQRSSQHLKSEIHSEQRYGASMAQAGMRDWQWSDGMRKTIATGHPRDDHQVPRKLGRRYGASLAAHDSSTAARPTHVLSTDEPSGQRSALSSCVHDVMSRQLPAMSSEQQDQLDSGHLKPQATASSSETLRSSEAVEAMAFVPVKRGRGRPRKHARETELVPVKRGRGRPRKTPPVYPGSSAEVAKTGLTAEGSAESGLTAFSPIAQPAKRGRGRPRTQPVASAS